MACRLNPRAFAPYLTRSLGCAFALALCLSGSQGKAAVSSLGDVYPSDNPFTDPFEGLPTGGNTVDFFLNVTDEQPNYEEEANVTVGQTDAAQLLINGGSILRYGHLIIGGFGGDGGERSADGLTDDDAATPGIQDDNIGTQNVLVGYLNGDLQFLPTAADSPTNGSGTVLIQGFGSVYNNDPNVIQARFRQLGSSPAATLFPVPADDVRGTLGNAVGAHRGFDAYVGLSGNGTLAISAGGRGEFQDALIVGYLPTGRGLVTVDGSGSYLEANGSVNTAPGGTGAIARDTGINQMVIGGYGYGEMRITNGGLVVARNGAAIGTTSTDPGNTDTNQDTDTFDAVLSRFGIGVVLVQGPSSVWNITPRESGLGSFGDQNSATAAALAIGQYFVDDTLYVPQAGSGTLTVADGGTVNVRMTPLSPIAPEAGPDQADALIGRFGTLAMDGGLLAVADQVVNDGLVRGSGSILSGTFRNRRLGQVRVDAGERLVIRSDEVDADAFESLTVNRPADLIFLGNLGLIEVVGNDQAFAELEFERAIAPGGTIDTAGRFVNQRDGLATPLVASDDIIGQIDMRDAKLRFRSGLTNAGVFKVLGGVNIVGGQVFNHGNSDLVFNDGLDGQVLVTNASVATFEDQVTNFGQFQINNKSNVTFQGQQFQNVGVLDIHDSNVNFVSGIANGDADVTNATLGAINIIGGPVNVQGVVLNRGNADAVDDSGGAMPMFDSRISVTNASTVTFEDAVTNDGVFTISGGSTVTFADGLTNNGVFIDLNPAEIYVAGDYVHDSAKLGLAVKNATEFTRMTVTGDASFTAGGSIDVSFINPLSLVAGQQYNLLTVLGTLSPDPLVDPAINLIGLPTTLAGMTSFSAASGGLVIDLVAAAPVIGSDLNGDNVVNQADLSIWQANYALGAGAAAMQGDVDGDGDVDGADYFRIVDNLGAVLGTVSVAAVPEPSSLAALALAVCGGLAIARRRGA